MIRAFTLYGENNSPLIDRYSAKYVIVRSKTIIALLGAPVNKQRLSFLEFVIHAREVGQVAFPATSVPAVFGEMPDLLSEERFVNTAKIYHELPDELRERAYMLIYGMALGIGLNVDNILRR